MDIDYDIFNVSRYESKERKMDEKKMDLNVEVKIKNKEGVVVTNRNHIDRCVQLYGNSISRNLHTKRCEELRTSSSLVNERVSNDEHE